MGGTWGVDGAMKNIYILIIAIMLVAIISGAWYFGLFKMVGLGSVITPPSTICASGAFDKSKPDSGGANFETNYGYYFSGKETTALFECNEKGIDNIETQLVASPNYKFPTGSISSCDLYLYNSYTKRTYTTHLNYGARLDLSFVGYNKPCPYPCPTGTSAGDWTYMSVDVNTYACFESSVPTSCTEKCPSNSAWTNCAGGTQTRTVYDCTSATGYKCQSRNEQQSCGGGVINTCPLDCPGTTAYTVICTTNIPPSACYQTRKIGFCNVDKGNICDIKDETIPYEIPCTGTAPASTSWSVCDSTGTQTRTNYECDNGEYKAVTETLSCEPPLSCPADAPLPSEWKCENNVKSRVNYQCDSTTDFRWKPFYQYDTCGTVTNNQGIDLSNRTTQTIIAVILIGALLTIAGAYYWFKVKK